MGRASYTDGMANGDLVSSDFAVVEELHRSSGGAVYVGRHRPSGRKVVLKERRVSELGHNHGLDNEVELYERVPRHPNLIAFQGCYRQGGAAGAGRHRGSSGERLVMVFEYASQGDLHNALLKQRSSGRYLRETQVLQWFLPIAAGVRHLHTHGIVHRDIKSLNIVLSEGVPKICDLGISRFRSDDTIFMQSFCGTPAYLSPEMVATQPYTEKTDVWALGVLLYELAALRLPFLGQSIVDISNQITRGEFPPLPEHYSPALSALVGEMLQLDADRRPSVDQAMVRAAALLEARAKRSEQQHRKAAHGGASPLAADAVETGVEADLNGASCAAGASPSRETAGKRTDQSAPAAAQRSNAAERPADPAASSRHDPSALQATGHSRKDRGKDDRKDSQSHTSPPRPSTSPVSAADEHAAAVVPLARAAGAASLLAERERSGAPPPSRGSDSSAASSIREQRLMQRWAERERRHGAMTPSDDDSRSQSSCCGGGGGGMEGRRGGREPPPGVPLPEEQREWTPEQLQAYVLAQQMAMIHASVAANRAGHPTAPTPPLRPSSAISAISSRPSTSHSVAPHTADSADSQPCAHPRSGSSDASSILPQGMPIPPRRGAQTPQTQQLVRSQQERVSELLSPGALSPAEAVGGGGQRGRGAADSAGGGGVAGGHVPAGAGRRTQPQAAAKYDIITGGLSRR